MIHKYSFMLYSFNFTVLFLMLSSFCFSFLFNFSSYFHGEIFHFYITLSPCHPVTSSIVVRNGKIAWKHGPYCWYFRLNLKYLRSPYRAYIKTAKNGDFSEKLLSENDFEAVLATFCCCDPGAMASEAVPKIAKDQKEYRKCSSCVSKLWKKVGS